MNEDQRNWDQHIPKVLFAYSRHVDVIHESTGYSVNFGRSPTLPVDIILGQIPERDGNNPSAFVQEISSSLKRCMTTHAKRNADQSNKSRKVTCSSE